MTDRHQKIRDPADFNPGDIVRLRGKEWRVQGIDDNARVEDLLLLALTEPVDSPDFVHAYYPVTRGSNRRPKDGGGYRWRWARAEHVELVSRGEPEAQARVGGEVSYAECCDTPAYCSSVRRCTAKDTPPPSAVPEVVGWLHEVVWEDGTAYSFYRNQPGLLGPRPGLVSERIGRAAFIAAPEPGEG